MEVPEDADMMPPKGIVPFGGLTFLILGIFTSIQKTHATLFFKGG